MPIVRIKQKLIYFAHVPKCAGTSVEDYMTARFGELGFLDRRHLSVSQNHSWNRCSPQHIDKDALDRVLPASFFAAHFTVVRHPVSRIASVFRYQRDIEGQIPKEMAFIDWLDSLSYTRKYYPYSLDNHCRKMTEFVPVGAKVFRLEDGLTPVIHWLDAQAENSDGSRQIRHVNAYVNRLKATKNEAGDGLKITAEVRSKIVEIYGDDYERFGYDKALDKQPSRRLRPDNTVIIDPYIDRMIPHVSA